MPRSKTTHKNGKVNYMVTKFHFEPPENSIIQDLAAQLQRIEDGVDTTLIYSYTTQLPPTFDPASPPHPMQPNSRAAMLVDKFYKLITPRSCTVNLFNDYTQRRTRCRNSSNGFRDIIDHNRVHHGRICHYFCLVEDCLAGFDKVCNAKRHQSSKHAVEEPESEDKDEEHAKLEIEKLMADAQRKKQLSKVRKGRVSKPNSRTSSKVQRKKHRKKAPAAKKTPAAPPAVLGLSSQMRRDSTSGDVTITVIPAGSVASDIGRFHSENMSTGKLTGNTHSTEQKEWVATTGLLDISYGPSKVNYEFNV